MTTFTFAEQGNKDINAFNYNHFLLKIETTNKQNQIEMNRIEN